MSIYKCGYSTTDVAALATYQYMHQIINTSVWQSFQRVRLRYTVANIKQSIGTLDDWSGMIDYAIRMCLNLKTHFVYIKVARSLSSGK